MTVRRDFTKVPLAETNTFAGVCWGGGGLQNMSEECLAKVWVTPE